MHIRFAVLTCLALILATLAGPQRVMAAPQPGAIYMAAGDSLGYGYVNDATPVDPQCTTANAIGYVCVFYRYLQQLRPGVQVVNVSVPGADSCVFLYGYPGPSNQCTHKPAITPAPSQVDLIVAQLKAHPGQVSPITIDIGGDDLLPLLPAGLTDPVGVAAALPDVFARFQANLDKSLATIRAADANVQILLMTQYNPLGGIGSPPLPAGFGEISANALNSLNAIIKSVGAKYNATVVDVAAVFSAFPTGAASLTEVPATLAAGGVQNMNIHPTPQGYQVYGQAVINAYSSLSVPLSASPAPPRINAHLAHLALPAGSMQQVRGKTDPGATVRIVVREGRGGHVRSYGATVRTGGAFQHTFRAGRSTGRVRVGVCATSRYGVTACSSTLVYMVR